MNLKTKIDRIEKKHMTDATTCPHLPPIVKYFEPDGTLDTTHGIPDETPCACERDRLEIHIQYVDAWRAE
jgi:hypothetical protein